MSGQNAVALQSAILDALAVVQDEIVINLPPRSGAEQNEMLFFLKPECFIGTSPDQQNALLEVALDLFARFGAIAAGALVLSGRELGRRHIMDRHYGFINKVSRSADLLSSEDKLLIRNKSGYPDETPIIGGHEFLEKYRDFDAPSLDSLWASKKSLKLRSGLYFEGYEVNGERAIIVNGFHPAQLAHFTQDNARIVLIVLQTDIPWRVLRTHMLGDTFPERAASGSFRRVLHDNSARFGLSQVSIAANAAHLSAGPFEAMFELSNFLTDSSTAKFSLHSTRTFRTLVATGAKLPEVEFSLQNPSAKIGGIEKSLFDATEETDTFSAVHLFHRFFLSKSAN
jgi:hypothetical protein